MFNTLLYTSIASAIKFAVGLYLALLLNENMPFKAMLRAMVLIPFDRAHRAVGAGVLVDLTTAQFSIISWSLDQARPDRSQHQLPRRPQHGARISVIFANIWRGVPFVAITLLAGLQTVSAIALRGGDAGRRHQLADASVIITYPLLTPIIAVVMTFSVLFTFTDFQLIWALTRGGPVNATHLMATLSVSARHHQPDRLGEGAAIATAMIPFLAGGDRDFLVRHAAPQVAARIENND